LKATGQQPAQRPKQMAGWLPNWCHSDQTT